ncbi:MAG: hypothetical protein A2V74_07595 [Acidobacteria bacterium RBG_16_70_10]|nr:MAG: hypothetical protein A2V74_07595 [Acidobacteria bacterium RBG_16_70_10]
MPRTRQELVRREVWAEVEDAHAETVARRETEDAFRAYQLGEVRILELLDADRMALRFRQRLTALQAEARRAESALERAIGF